MILSGDSFKMRFDFLDVVCNKYNIFCMKLVQYNEYLVSTVGTDGLVL